MTLPISHSEMTDLKSEIRTLRQEMYEVQRFLYDQVSLSNKQMLDNSY